MKMSKESLRELLYQKASKEQEVYVEHIKRLPPELIIEKAYEKVMRDDILMTFEDDYLSDKQIAELTKLDYPLLACYNEWMETDASHMEMLRDTIDEYTKELVKENEEQKLKDKKKHEPER